MCCKQPYWVEEESIAICRNCGANKPLNRPNYIPYIGPTIIPPTWIPISPYTTPFGGTTWGTGQSIGKVNDGHQATCGATQEGRSYYDNIPGFWLIND